MFRNQTISLIGMLFLCSSFVMSAIAENIECEVDNAALQAMYRSTVSFESSSGEDIPLASVSVKTADNNATRAQGFQRVCASTIAATPILFLFANPVVPSFHMHNVVAAIDIAFIDAQGKIESIHAMQPYSLLLKDKPLYSSKRPIVAALEARPGFYSDNNLVEGDTVRWVTESSE